MNSGSPLAPLQTAWTHRSLILSLTWHSVVSRYRTSWFGLLWPILHPVLLIGVFTLVFVYVMPLRWVSEQNGQVGFPLFLYSGLVVFTLFSDVANRAPGLVLENVNLVKKVVFPLEILPLVSVFSALIYFVINFAVLLVFIALSPAPFSVDLPALLMMLIPFVLFLAGLSWFLAGLTVYVRDVQHFIGLLVSALMFLSPVFYPLSSAPEAARAIMGFNPLALAIETLRAAVLGIDAGSLPGAGWLWLLGVASFYLGHLWFMKLREGFADVL